MLSTVPTKVRQDSYALFSQDLSSLTLLSFRLFQESRIPSLFPLRIIVGSSLSNRNQTKPSNSNLTFKVTNKAKHTQASH